MRKNMVIDLIYSAFIWSANCSDGFWIYRIGQTGTS